MRAFIPSVHGVSTVDWPGKVVSVIYFSGCNFRCKFCYNVDLLEQKQEHEMNIERVKLKVKENLPILDGIVFTGGEPLIQFKACYELAKWAKRKGLGVGLHTNGCFPEELKILIDDGLLDYVAVDIKAPFEKYEEITQVKGFIDRIRKTIEILKNSNIDYEFRTTLVPGLVDYDDLDKIKNIVGESKYVIQKFKNDAPNYVDNSFKGKSFSQSDVFKIKGWAKRNNAILRHWD